MLDGQLPNLQRDCHTAFGHADHARPLGRAVSKSEQTVFRGRVGRGKQARAPVGQLVVERQAGQMGATYRQLKPSGQEEPKTLGPDTACVVGTLVFYLMRRERLSGQLMQ